MMYSNDKVTLTLYKESFRKVCRDYVIRFSEEQHRIEEIIHISSDIVKQLIGDYHRKDKTVSGRLVALVKYIRANSNDEVVYYHPSYQTEVIEDANDFFVTHMLKIAQRLDDFNKNGSKLFIKAIVEIHLHLTCVN